MKLLITGSTGFLGRHLLLQALNDRTFSTIILPVRNPEKLQQQLRQDSIPPQDHRLLPCPVVENRWLLPPLAQETEVVIHAAGLLFARHRADYFQSNVKSTLHLLEALPEKSRFLALSSQSAAGPTREPKQILREQDLPAPITWYGESKLAMEKELLARLPERLLLLRPPMILGPGDRAILPLLKMANSSLRVKPGFFKKEYSWIAVDDLCRALLLAAKQEWRKLSGQLYFVANQKSITDLELLETTAALLKSPGVTLRLPHFIIKFLSMILDQIPALQDAYPSLGRDRVKEMLEQRWVVDGSAFEKDFSWIATKSLPQVLEEIILNTDSFKKRVSL